MWKQKDEMGRGEGQKGKEGEERKGIGEGRRERDKGRVKKGIEE